MDEKNVQMVPVQSSQIEAVGYEAGRMLVKFRHGGVYAYKGVPPKIHAQLMQAESKGKFLAQEVKGTFQHERVA